MIFLAVCFLISFSFFFSWSRARAGTSVLIRCKNREYIYPLEEERTINLKGSLGEIKIRIEDARVFVLSSSCPDKDCMRMGPISWAGEWIACLPNRVFLRIQGGEKNEVDALSY